MKKMTPTVLRRAVVPLLFVFPMLQGTASSVDPEVEACIRKNTAKTTAIQKIELRSTDRIGSEKLLFADIYLKRFNDQSSGLIAYFREPEDLRGTRLLVIEKQPANEMYLYMPALFKIRRITSKRISSSMYGSDFSYEDLERLYGMLSSEAVEQKADALIEGEAAYVLVSRPSEDSGSKYESVVSYFDKKSCVIRKVEFFEPGARLRKILLVDAGKVRRVGDIMVPHEYRMNDIRDKTETRMSVRDVRLDIPVADTIFDHTRLKDFRGLD
jgi:hypothetical protein